MHDNTENLGAIANRCKELREIWDVSVEQLSKDIGVDALVVELYESGSHDIPISFLTKLAHRFNVEVVDLITGGSAKLKTYTLCRKNRGVRVQRQEEYEYEALVSNFSHKKCDPYIVTVQPDEDKPWYMNSHDGHEFDLVIEGQIKMMIEDQEVTLNEGDSIYLDSQYMHALKAVGATAKFLAVVLP